MRRHASKFVLSLAAAALAAAALLAELAHAVRLGAEGEPLRVVDLLHDLRANDTEEVINKHAGECPKEPKAPPSFPYEFGWEMNIAVPHAYWLHKTCNGMLLSTSSCTLDFSAYYWFSPKHTVENCSAVQSFRFGMDWEDLGVADYLRNNKLPGWTPPPHKAHYSALPVMSSHEYSLLEEKKNKSSTSSMIQDQEAGKAAEQSAKPLVWDRHGTQGIAILNKHHVGNNGGFLQASVLRDVMTQFKESCPDTGVMYYRNWAFKHDEPDSVPLSVDSDNLTEGDALKVNPNVQSLKEVSERHLKTNMLLQEFDTDEADSDLQSELDAVRTNPMASLLEELKVNNSAMTLQEIQMRVLSRYNCFISVHGGNSELAANFGGTMLLYINNLRWYEKEPTMKRLANIGNATIYRVHDDDELKRGIELFTKDGCKQCVMN